MYSITLWSLLGHSREPPSIQQQMMCPFECCWRCPINSRTPQTVTNWMTSTLTGTATTAQPLKTSSSGPRRNINTQNVLVSESGRQIWSAVAQWGHLVNHNNSSSRGGILSVHRRTTLEGIQIQFMHIQMGSIFGRSCPVQWQRRHEERKQETLGQRRVMVMMMVAMLCWLSYSVGEGTGSTESTQIITWNRLDRDRDW